MLGIGLGWVGWGSSRRGERREGKGREGDMLTSGKNEESENGAVD